MPMVFSQDPTKFEPARGPRIDDLTWTKVGDPWASSRLRLRSVRDRGTLKRPARALCECPTSMGN